MTKENIELLDSMVDAVCQDVLYQFDLDRGDQAIKLIRQSLKRLEKEDI